MSRLLHDALILPTRMTPRRAATVLPLMPLAPRRDVYAAGARSDMRAPGLTRCRCRRH
jgi:hypothetical protein